MKLATINDIRLDAAKREAIAASFDLSPVKRRYAREFQKTDHEAEKVLAEIKRFLILCSLSSQGLGAGGALDDMWHVFMLFTARYENFCHQVCNRFIHHVPEEEFEGTATMHDRHKNYRATVEFYRDVFQQPPDFSIWPRPLSLDASAERPQVPMECGSCGGGCNGLSAPPESPRCHGRPLGPD